MDYFKTYDPVRKGDKVLFVERVNDVNEGLLYTDFSVRSLIDAEAIDLLSPLSPISASRLAALDSAQVAASNIETFVNNNVKDSE